MLLPVPRAAIVSACHELARAGLVVGTAGNVSVREGDLVAVTPSGVRYRDLTPDLVGVHRLDGTAAQAPLAPTSELPLHLALYQARPELGAVVHTHSPAATALSALVDEVPPVHYYMALFGGPVRVAPYAVYGSAELAAHVVRALRGRTGCLMGSHGAVTVGPDLDTALDKSSYLEWLCDVYLRAAAAGTPRLLPPAEIDAVAAKLAGYGQPDPARGGEQPGLQIAGARLLAAQGVVRVHQLADAQRQAAAADAAGEPVAQPLQLADPLVQVGAPLRRQPGPVPGGGSPAGGQPGQGVGDPAERDSDLLRGADERHPAQRRPRVAALVARGAAGGDETPFLVKAQRRDSYPAARRELPHGQLAGLRRNRAEARVH
jgi:L-fuculose-phosphate aldolase